MDGLGSLKMPDPMDMEGDLVENWKTFDMQWQIYQIAANVEKESDERQAAILLWSLGPKCCKVVYNLATLTDNDCKKAPKKIIQELEKHFLPTRNVVRKRFVFLNAPKQHTQETFDQYDNRLRELVKHCEFDTQEESILRDKLVWGTKDPRAQERILRMQPVPGYMAVKQVLKAAEDSQLHARLLNPDVEEISAHSVAQARNVVNKRNNSTQDSKSKADVNCTNYCGGQHPKGQCPAYGKECKNCGRRNHFAKVCRAPASRKVHQSQANEDNTQGNATVYSVEFIGSTSTSNMKESTFMKPVQYSTGTETKVMMTQMDSGANSCAMSLKDLKTILAVDKVSLKNTDRKIKLYDGSIVNVLGQYSLKITVDEGPKHDLTFDILRNSPWPIIDGETCVEKGFIIPGRSPTIHSLQDKQGPVTEEFIDRYYSDVFSGLGCLPGECHLEVDKSVRPVQHPCRRSPIAMKPKMKVKLDSMEGDEIITPVTEPTDWISSSVAVLKQNGDIRICLDPKDLNRALKRPKYQMPTLDEVLPELSKAKVFTVLDAKDGFHQIKLDEESSYLTIFWTPFRRYRYLRMPMGIS